MLNNEDIDIQEITKKRNELLKRIEEKQRLMELIRNPHIKDSLAPIEKMKRNRAVKKIQTYWRNRKNMKQEKEIQKKNKLYSKYIFASQLGNTESKKIKPKTIIDITFIVVKLQRSVRKFLNKLHREKAKALYIHQLQKEFYDQMKYDRVADIRNDIANKVRTMPRIENNFDYQKVLNEYYDIYRNYCMVFPNHIKVREDNFCYYYQCLSLIQHMENQKNLESASQFSTFSLDKNKEAEVKLRLNKILESSEHKMWWYKYDNIDDFEETNILNEIDTKYKFEKRSDILNKKK